MRRHNPTVFVLFVLSVLLFSLMSCAHYLVNKPLGDESKAPDYYTFKEFYPHTGQDDVFEVLTFSGGGTRAAALSYGVLKELRDMHLSNGESLLDEVDLISTVSGGSFTGAYYALFGDQIFKDFGKKFLYRNIQGELTEGLFNPVNLVRLASPDYSRIDMAAELYDKTIFDSKTFGYLDKKKKGPFIVINATNLQNGARFGFTGDQFSYLWSDIRKYPISRAVAASSAFPFLLSPISLDTYPHPKGYELPLTDKAALKDYWNNRRAYTEVADNIIYLKAKKHPYVHLLDGGLADNLGLRAVDQLYRRGGIRQAINNGKIKKMLVIVVNAQTRKHENFDKKSSPPGLATVAEKTCTVSMDNYSFETVERFKEMLEARTKTQQYVDQCTNRIKAECPNAKEIPPLAGAGLKLYVVDLSFDNLQDKKERDYFNNLPTSFELDKEQVDKLIAVGGKLLLDHPEFKRFMKDNTQ